MSVVCGSFLVLAGMALRYCLISSPLAHTVAKRVEVSTPVNSWERVTEGVYLLRHGQSPYEGDIFHEPPLALWLYNLLITNLSDWIPFIFIACDVATAVLMSLVAKLFVSHSLSRGPSSPHLEKKETMSKAEDAQVIPLYVASVYLFCPYSLMSCVAKSTTVFTNLAVGASVLLAFAGRRLASMLFLAVASYQSFYHAILVVPVLLCPLRPRSGSDACRSSTKPGAILSSLVASAAFVGTVVILLFASKEVAGSWKFLHSTYGCTLSVPDLTPNIGLFWYFFVEMFEHFRTFFLWTFQINAFVYVIPLAVRFRKEPYLLACIFSSLVAVFKSYPSVGDVAFYLAWLPMWKHLFPYLRQTLLVGCVMASCTVLAPVLWHLWIFAGSANANFYFGLTLAFETAQIFLITDLLFAYIKWEYYLEHGPRPCVDGKPIPLELK